MTISMDLASVVAALASVGVRVSGSAPNSSVQVDSSRACPTGLAGPEPSGTINDPGQHFQGTCSGCTTNHTTQCGHKHFVNDARRGAGVCNKCSTGVQPCSTGQLKQSERREYGYSPCVTRSEWMFWAIGG